MIELRADDWFQITGRGWVATFDNVFERQEGLHPDFDPRELLGRQVKIDGKEYKVHGVETQGYIRHRFGLLIGAYR